MEGVRRIAAYFMRSLPVIALAISVVVLVRDCGHYQQLSKQYEESETDQQSRYYDLDQQYEQLRQDQQNRYDELNAQYGKSYEQTEENYALNPSTTNS